jgi:ABC-type transport system involved in Fe-S cluster assembly fused permease/ATPase subunit
MSAEREVIFEFLRIGAALKVTAVDVASGTEVSMVGDPNAGQETLRRLALQKLDYVMGRKQA